VLLGVVACAAPAVPRAPELPAARSHAACRTSQDSTGIDRVPDGATITHVDVHGIGVDANEIMPQLQTRVGAKLDREVLRADVRRLWQLGLASQIAVSAEQRDDGYAIDLALQPPLRVTAVEITGATRAQVPMLAVIDGTLHDPGRLQHVAAATQAWLRVRGYPHAEITAEAVPDCDGVVVHVAAALHEHVTIARIDVRGSALPVSANTFERELGTVDVVGGAYSEAAFRYDLSTLVGRHHDHGYLDAEVGDPIAVAADATHVNVTAVITPGPRYKLGALAVTGGTDAARHLVDARLQPLRGQWYDARTFEAVVAAAEDDLDALGFHLVSERLPDRKLAIYNITLELEANKR
jgi:outer membrane protein assembly factor BamA